MTMLRLSDRCWAATLISLPLSGVGLIHALTGHDLGAGLQPAYLLVALTWLFRILGAPAQLWAEVRSPHRRPGWVVLGALLAVAIVSGLGLWIAPAPVVGHEAVPRFLRQFIQLAVMVAFTVQAWLWTSNGDRWRRTLRWLSVGLAAQIIYAVVQALIVVGWLPWLMPLERLATSNPAILSGSAWLYLGEYLAVPRLRGSMCEPLYLGSYLLAVVPLVLASGRRWWGLAGLGLLLLTWSRGAWLAALVGAVAWLILSWRAGLPRPGRRWWIGLVGMGAAAAGVGVIVSGLETVGLPWQRVMQSFDVADWSNLTRFYSAQAAWRAFLQSPLVGVGWGQYAYHFYDLVDATGLQSQFTWPVVNSVPLLILSETGLLGLSVAIAGGVVVWRRTWRRFRTLRPGEIDATMIVALGAAVSACSAQLLLFSQYNLPHLWVLPGLWLAVVVPVDPEESP